MLDFSCLSAIRADPLLPCRSVYQRAKCELFFIILSVAIIHWRSKIPSGLLQCRTPGSELRRRRVYSKLKDAIVIHNIGYKWLDGLEITSLLFSYVFATLNSKHYMCHQGIFLAIVLHLPSSPLAGSLKLANNELGAHVLHVRVVGV